MSLDKPKYDVAISFLSRDEPTAAALHEHLSEGLEVFFYPRSQEDLAGTNGLESMKEPFADNSRVSYYFGSLGDKLLGQGWNKTQLQSAV
jgi:hypothetical protein